MERKVNLNGVGKVGENWIINCAPHTLRFLYEPTGEEVILESSGLTLKADLVPTPITETATYIIHKTEYVPSAEGQAELEFIQQELPNVFIVGSIISAQAWPGKVLANMPVEGQEREDPAKRQYSATRFTTY